MLLLLWKGSTENIDVYFVSLGDTLNENITSWCPLKHSLKDLTQWYISMLFA